MATVVDICNLALANLGASPTISSIDPPEGSQWAVQAAIFYPRVRDATLQSQDWTFARRRQTLSLLTSTVGAWTYSYTLPADCLTPRRLLGPGAADDAAQNYKVETDGDQSVIYTDQDSAELIYTARITNPAQFSPLFVMALSWNLTAELAMPITRKPALQKNAIQMGEYYRKSAGAADANSEHWQPVHNVPWLAGRK